ncbi:MAG: hypothetical protein F4Y18_03020 [Cenarchaeum sp. SB0663_bin_5]|nr:hypothetical protein [Cenarchaeum sp. SB0663_bin_5]
MWRRECTTRTRWGRDIARLERAQKVEIKKNDTERRAAVKSTTEKAVVKECTARKAAIKERHNAAIEKIGVRETAGIAMRKVHKKPTTKSGNSICISSHQRVGPCLTCGQYSNCHAGTLHIIW